MRMSPRSTAFFATSPAASITLGFDVFVQLVMAAITTSPCFRLILAGVNSSAGTSSTRSGVGRFCIISISVSGFVFFSLVNGAVAEFPPALLDQLAEGGRLVGVRRPGPGPGAAMLMLKRHGAVAGRPLFETATPYLPGLAPRPRFIF